MSDRYGLWTSKSGLQLVAPSCQADVQKTEAAEKEYARDNPMSYYARSNDNNTPAPDTPEEKPWHYNPMDFFRSGEQLEIEDYIEWATREKDQDIDL